MTSNATGVDVTNAMEDEGGGVSNNPCNQPQPSSAQTTRNNILEHPLLKPSDIASNICRLATEFNIRQQQAVDIFAKHVSLQHKKELQRERRPSLPGESIELSTLNGVVMRRKQQLQMRQQQQEQEQHQQKARLNQKHLAPASSFGPKGRPLSTSSISSAASSNSNSSANSSASSGVQSSFTRNGSLNYGHEYRKSAYLASIESLNNSTHVTFNINNGNNIGNTSEDNDRQSIEAALKNLNLTPSGPFKDAAARAAVLAAGAQTRGFGSRINRSLHSSLRYDKNTAYRIHLMANARAILDGSNAAQTNASEGGEPRRGGSVSRNNSSTSSDSGHHPRQNPKSNMRSSRFVCRCSQSSPSIASSSSASQVDQSAINENESTAILSNTNKSATLYSTTCHRSNIQHHSDCYYSRFRSKKASDKLQPSPSSASSHSNTSSLFRDDGFEDDFTSTTSEHMSTYSQHHHRLSFRRPSVPNHQYPRGTGDDDDEYQSCEEELSNSHTTASTTSNLDDCALSTTSSSIIHHEQQVLDKISLANAKQQYRKSLLLEHQQQQHLLHAQHVGSQNKIQSLLSSSPKICQLSSLSPNSSANISTTSSTSSASSKQTKCDDRTVNIIGHMPTKSPGYWDSNLSITQRVVTEIIETERTYVDDLEQIVTGYICYLRNVLKQQKHQQSQGLDAKQPVIDSNSMVNKNSTDDDNKSMLVFDDDTTSATNEVEDLDVEETDNYLAMKENVVNAKSAEVKSEACASNGAIITASHIKKLFINLEDIYKFNKDLLFRLEECYLNPSSVAECFVENASGFEIYTHYCTMYPQVVSTLTELMGNPISAQLLKERQNELNQSLPLGAYLLKPVQRILKYHILFQSLIKHTTDDNAVNEKDRQLINEAFSVMTSIACHINAMKKRHEHAIRVQEVQGLLVDWEGPDLTTLGELILEDTFKLYNRPKSGRHLFLFDNVLLITKKKRDGSLSCKGHIAVSIGFNYNFSCKFLLTLS